MSVSIIKLFKVVNIRHDHAEGAIFRFALGNKNARMLSAHADRPEIHAHLQTALARPSLYDEVLRLLARRGFTIAADRIDRDWTQPYQADDSVRAVHSGYTGPATGPRGQSSCTPL